MNDYPNPKLCWRIILENEFMHSFAHRLDFSCFQSMNTTPQSETGQTKTKKA